MRAKVNLIKGEPAKVEIYGSKPHCISYSQYNFPATLKAANVYLNLIILAKKGHILSTSQPKQPVNTAESLKRRLRSKDAVSSKDGYGPWGYGF